MIETIEQNRVIRCIMEQEHAAWRRIMGAVVVIAIGCVVALVY